MANRMTAAATGTVIRYLGSLFPRWKTTPELVTLWSEVLCRYEEPVVRRVIAEHRQERRGDDPSLPDVREALAAARPAPLALPARASAPTSDVGDVGYWLQRLYRNPAELQAMVDDQGPVAGGALLRGLDWMREIWGIDDRGNRVPPETKTAWTNRRMQALRAAVMTAGGAA